MDLLKDFRRLSGFKIRTESTAASETDTALIRAFSKKTKLGSYNIDEVAQALSVLEPGWKSEVVIGLLPLRDGSLNPKVSEPGAQHAWAEAHGLTDADFTYYSPTEAGFSYSYSSDWPSRTRVSKSAQHSKPFSKSELDGVTRDFLATLFVNVGKDEKHPEEGKFYIKAISKPKVTETEAAQHAHHGMPESLGQTGVRVTLRWKFTGVRKAVRSQRLIAPNGDFLDLEDNGKPSPGLWTWLYKRGVDKQAQDWMASSGQTAKDAQKKALKGYAANEVIGTCGICNNIQKLRKGELVLHGYSRPGYGWIQGECFGVGYKAWELSSESGVAYIESLVKSIPQQKAKLDWVKQVTEYEVYINDQTLSDDKNPGLRLYLLTSSGFELRDSKKVSYTAAKQSGLPIVSPWKLDASNAEKYFDQIKERRVSLAQTMLQQMEDEKVRFEAAVAQWKPRPLPGAQMQESLEQLRHLAGIR